MPPRRRSPYTWQPAPTARYRGQGGRFVPRADVRRAIDQALLSEQRRMRWLANELRGGRLSIAGWQEQMREAMKSLHLYSGAAARGGFGQMGPRQFGQIGATLRQQYKFLDNFATQIEGGLVLDGRFLGRVRLYAEAGRSTYHRLDREVQQDAGMTEEKNLLALSDHCTSCIEQSDLDWVPIGTLENIGERDCLHHCKCSIIYR